MVFSRYFQQSTKKVPTKYQVHSVGVLKNSWCIQLVYEGDLLKGFFYGLMLVACSVLIIDLCAPRYEEIECKSFDEIFYEDEVVYITENVLVKVKSTEDVSSGMPCERYVRPSVKDGWLHENKRSRHVEESEVVVDEVVVETDAVVIPVYETSTESCTYEAVIPETVTETVVEMVVETEVETVAEEVVEETWIEEVVDEVVETEASSGIPIYAVNGEVLDRNVQKYLYEELAKYGIQWFMPYSIMIAYQESHFNFSVVNPVNGIDMGLFQYRVYYYPGGNIFDPYEQIRIFCQQMANRANAGCDVYTMISRHNTSDYCPYNQAYVNEVLQHQGALVQIGFY